MSLEITPDDIITPEKWKTMVFPCCKKKLPAPLTGVALVTCSCGKKFLPNTIIEYNNKKGCPECKGHGFWWKQSCKLELYAEFSKPEKVICPKCKGTGKEQSL